MKKQYFYIAQSPSYGGAHNIKIGISDDPWKRIKSIQRKDSLFKLYAVFKFQDTDYPLHLETAMKRHLIIIGATKKYQGCEYFYGQPCEYLKTAEAFIRQDEKQYERVL